jgi:hypothetical protein
MSSLMDEEPQVAQFGGTYKEPQSSTSLTNASALGHQEEGEGERNEEIDPTQDEMERERLMAKAEQLQDDIEKLRAELRSKEVEMAEVKRALGITPYVEFKQSVSHGLEVVGSKFRGLQDTQGYRKVDEKLTGWKSRVEESPAYQKTVTTLSDGSKKASGAISNAGTRIKENEKVKAIGEKTSTAFKKTGTVIKERASTLREKMRPSTDHGDGETQVPDVAVETQPNHQSDADREN